MRKLCLYGLLTLLHALASCQSEPRNAEHIANAPLLTKSYTDDLGREIVLKKAPERVIYKDP